MKMPALLILMVLPWIAWAHDVPDDVRMTVFLKPDGDRMLILVRIPANALIDILFPTLPESDWLDLKQIDGFAEEGAKVWIADLLSIYEGDHLLPAPRILSTRVARRGDPSFRSFPEAMKHMHGERLPLNALLLQDKAVVDALLETPIHSMNSAFRFQPRFARLGVRVMTTLTFLPAQGDVRQFEYEGDPEPFNMNPSWNLASAHFVETGFAEGFNQTDNLLFLLCAALVFRRFRALTIFAAAFFATEACIMIGWAAGWAPPPSPEFAQAAAILVSAAVMYLGIEVIVDAKGGRSRAPVAAASGLIFGAAFWMSLDPLLQFGGAHRLLSAVSFDAGLAFSQIFVLALVAAALPFLLRLSRAPQIAVIIAAAIAIRISWHRMIDRAHALGSFSTNLPDVSSIVLFAAIAACVFASILFVLRSNAVQRRTR